MIKNAREFYEFAIAAIEEQDGLDYMLCYNPVFESCCAIGAVALKAGLESDDFTELNSSPVWRQCSMISDELELAPGFSATTYLYELARVNDKFRGSRADRREHVLGHIRRILADFSQYGVC